MKVDTRIVVAAAVWCVAAGAVARELAPGTCAARFDVQRDKIIRTEESREMGARYLSELDVGSRHECRRLCCETDSCDVFVYEEKSPGSCYLFDCGPPEDFRCKFTAHGNFSSGVLALSRRLAELQDQERLTQPSAPTTTTPPPTARPPPTAPPPPPPHLPPQSTQSPPVSSRCSRYQFECRVGGECIAVYNACDGVPQCADGSDEAAELGCPPPAPPPAPPTAPRPAPQPAPRPVLRPAAAPSIPYFPVEPQVSRSEEMAEAGGGGGGGDVERAWPHRLAQAQPPRRYSEGEDEVAPHIFSHKGGLVQEPGAMLPYESAWRRAGWPAELTGPAKWPAAAGQAGWPTRRRPRPDADRSPGMEMSAENGEAGWGEIGEWRGWGAGGAAGPPLPPDRTPHLRPGEIREFPGAETASAASGTMPELAVPYGAGGVAGGAPRDAPKKAPPARPAPPATPAPTALPRPPPDLPTPRAQEHKNEPVAAAVSQTHAHFEVAGAGAGAGAGQRDGPSERPPAAVLLLVLGLAMTGVAGAAAGCRVRAARRRLRRGGGRAPLAHDADYLVNGMYL